MYIGILSMQRIINYGSFLQAYALKMLIEGLGDNVTFIDIKDGEYRVDSHSTEKRIIDELKIHNIHLLKWILKYRKTKKQIQEIILNAQERYLGLLPEVMDVDNNLEAVVIGSDEVFNCAPTCSWGISTQLFGNIDVQRVISYAASCGYTEYTDIPEQLRESIGSNLRKMQAVSVRDANTYYFVEAISGVKADYHIDPVLAYDYTSEISNAEKNMKFDCEYIIVYAYTNRIRDKEEIKEIKWFAKEQGLKTYCVGGMQTWCDEYPAWNPFEVLAGFKHAKYIVTDTFHGTVMSAKFNKPFATIVRGSNKNKLDDLLQRFDLSSHKIDDIKQLKSILQKTIDYEAFNKRITDERKRSLEYLQRYLR